MSDYRLTNRGKIVLSLFILVLVAIIYSSAVYIVSYYSSRLAEKEPDETVIQTSEQPETVETVETVESSTEAVIETTEVVTDEERIYTVLELDDLKQFKMTIYFDDLSDSVELSQSDLETIDAMLKLYPNEKIAIAGHVNGYPNFITNSDADALSLRRSEFVKKVFLQLGIEASLISLYDFGVEKPLYKDYGNQMKNNRVEIYFEDHFVNGDGGK